jgi:hypothetical protein
MKKSYLVSFILAALAIFVLYRNESPVAGAISFEGYKQEHGKVYSRVGEEEYRKVIFLKNLIKIQEHNAKPSSTWQMSVNQFTDLSEAEFAALYLTLKVPQDREAKVTAEPQLLNRVGG